METQQYSNSKKKGCPTCDGVDPFSCVRCGGRARLCDWYYLNGWTYIQPTYGLKMKKPRN